MRADHDLFVAVAHASELPLLFGTVSPAANETDFGNTWLDLYINFINDLNPGGTLKLSGFRSASPF